MKRPLPYSPWLAAAITCALLGAAFLLIWGAEAGWVSSSGMLLFAMALVPIGFSRLIGSEEEKQEGGWGWLRWVPRKIQGASMSGLAYCAP